ncbi:unnamed protein product [Clonostachys byssicola]|uniref:Uncharacterized protein n=1 Tax=Clonostachys byssicola TaxID=160290 RepID=A0A9N9URU3_9HYPO|nr:unnamed protein product [Clonostachys byssicola]
MSTEPCPWEETLIIAAANGDTTTLSEELKKGKDVNCRDTEFGRTALSWAAERGHTGAVQILLDAQAKVDTPDALFGRTPLTQAAANGHVDMTELLLRSGADFNACDTSGERPLLQASRKGHAAVAKLLLEAGADPNVRAWKKGQTSLSLASIYDHIDVVQVLLDYGANIDLEDDCNCERTPMIWAAINGHEAILKLLLEHKASLDSEDSKRGMSPLAWAITEGEEGATALLLESSLKGPVQFSALQAAATTPGNSKILSKLLDGWDVDVNGRDYGSYTLLALAARHGCDEQFRVLLDRGADPHVCFTDERTIISFAAEGGALESVKLLLQSSTDVNHQDDVGASPLSRAAAEGEHEVVRILVEAGAMLDAQDKKGRTALFWAARKGHSDVAKVLIDNRADLDLAGSEWGRTALHFAIERENVEVAKLLITAGASLNIKDGEGRAPLSYAAEQGLEDVVALLVEKGADVNMSDDTEDDGMWDTMVPLSWAAANGNGAVIRILLAHDASVNPDIEGRPPLMHAFQEEKDEAMQLLLEHGANPFGGDFSDECVLRGVAKCGLKDIVALCLRQNAPSVEVRQESIWWALVEASHNDHAEVVELLLQQNPFSFPIADLTPWDLAEDEEVLRLLQPYRKAMRKRVERED